MIQAKTLDLYSYAGLLDRDIYAQSLDCDLLYWDSKLSHGYDPRLRLRYVMGAETMTRRQEPSTESHMLRTSTITNLHWF